MPKTEGGRSGLPGQVLGLLGRTLEALAGFHLLAQALAAIGTAALGVAALTLGWQFWTLLAFGLSTVIALVSVGTAALAYSRFKVFRTARAKLISLSKKNAYCDKALFDNLFSEFSVNGDKGAALRVAKNTVTQNIQSVLDDARDIYVASTSRSCAVSVRLLDSYRRISVRYRDSESRSSRTRRDREPVSVDTNSAYIAIVKENRSYFLCNNLVALKEKYINLVPDWQEEYTAKLVFPIIDIAASSGAGRYPASQGPGIAGFLWIDNKGGGFDSQACLDYAEELSFRLAVMLYRVQEMDKQTAFMKGK
jgi:hypothetical protein